MSQPTSPLTTSSVSDNVPLNVPLLDEIVVSPAARLYHGSPARLAETHALSERVEIARSEMATVLRYWAYRPEVWQVVGFTTAADVRPYAALSIAHPIIEVTQARMVVRRQQMGLTENDVIARHAFMEYLAESGLPVPSLVGRGPGAGAGARGTTWAAVPIVPLTDPQHASGVQYVIEQAIYEIQTYVPGRRFVTDGPAGEDDLVVAARTLAALHQASFAYAGPEHRWPRERAMGVLAGAYLTRIAEAGRQERRLSRPLAAGLRRLAREGARWGKAAEQQLAARHDLPCLLVHGDYQPHNLAFAPASDATDRVVAIYDFDAMHRDWRVAELAYALLAFAGLRWDEPTNAGISAPNPPLVAQGLDLDRAEAFLGAYGAVAPPRASEAELLGDALLLVLPIVFANGVAEDLVFFGEQERPNHPPRECGPHIAWAESFPDWIAAHRDALRDAWQHASGQ
ncbi:MAG TPA: phosphotransferase [Ktedonobacterales bacterium]